MYGHTAEICSCDLSKKHAACNNISEGYKAFASHLHHRKQKNNQTRLTSRSLKVLLYVLVLASSLYVCNIQFMSRLHVQFFFIFIYLILFFSLLVFATSCSDSGKFMWGLLTLV